MPSPFLKVKRSSLSQIHRVAFRRWRPVALGYANYSDKPSKPDDKPAVPAAREQKGEVQEQRSIVRRICWAFGIDHPNYKNDTIEQGGTEEATSTSSDFTRTGLQKPRERTPFNQLTGIERAKREVIALKWRGHEKSRDRSGFARRKSAPLSRYFAPRLSGFQRWLRSPRIEFRSIRVRLQQIRKRIRPPRSDVRGMKSWVQILSTPADDTSGTTLILHFDNKRYFFGNVGEGTQRACIQRKISLAKIQDVFLTGRLEWRSTGGILGMVLTLADVLSGKVAETKMLVKQGKALAAASSPVKLTLHGPENLMHTLATARRFVFRKGLPLAVDEFRARDETADRDYNIPSWRDENIQVWAMPVDPQTTPKTVRKRSHEEMSGVAQAVQNGDSNQEVSDEENRIDQIRQGVVASMFNSEWQLDALHTIHLQDVKMPAAIFVRREGKIEKYEGPLPGGKDPVPDIEVLVRSPWPGALIESLPPARVSPTTVSYIIKGHTVRGKFQRNVAMGLGVKPGPDFSKLTRGESVTLDDGTVIDPSQVLAPSKEGGSFAVVELPASDYVRPLIERKEWQTEAVMSNVSAIVWILGEGVAENAELLAFMKGRPHISHVVSSSDCCGNRIALESPAIAAVRLNLIDAERFPVPQFNNDASLPTSDIFSAARVGATLQIEPKFELQNTELAGGIDVDAITKEQPEELVEMARAAREKIGGAEYIEGLEKLQQDIPNKDAEIITLGTGSALPSKYRNVSATMVRVPGVGSYLFDCGENTLGQLKRVFGGKLPAVLRDLKAIWISHLHADHHLGTISVIKAWHEETSKSDDCRCKTLMVASAEHMLAFLKEYSEVEDFGHDRIVPLRFGRRYGFDKSFDGSEEHGLSSISACLVPHCFDAMAVVFEFASGFKVAYSGDCRPSENFIRIGQGATLLIHEATFDDELRGDAVAKKHSTTSEALKVGRDMGARRILLTHFSQRYQKIPVMETSDTDQVAIVAFDYMRCKLGDFAKLSEFRPALAKLYEDKED